MTLFNSRQPVDGNFCDAKRVSELQAERNSTLRFIVTAIAHHTDNGNNEW